MEVVGAMASFIAIGQAIESGPKAFRLVRGIINPGREFDPLVEELVRLENYYQYVTDIVTPQTHLCKELDVFSQIVEPPYLKRLRLDLEDFSSRLRGHITESGSTTPDSEKLKISRRRWFAEKHEIKQLRNTCVRLSRELEAAMGPYALMVQGSTIQATFSIMKLLKEHSSLSKGDHGSGLGHLKPHDGDTHGKMAATATVHDSSESIVDHSISTGQDRLEIKDERILQRQKSLPVQFAIHCGCTCHKARQIGRKPHDKKRLIGFFSIYPTTDHSLLWSCHGCLCVPTPAISRIRFRIPMLHRKGAFDTVFTFGQPFQFNMSLRPIIYIPNKHEIWASVYQPDMAVLRATMSQYSFSITDEGPGGLSILELILYNDFDFVSNNLNIFTHLTNQAGNDDAKSSAAWLCLWTSRNLRWLSDDDRFRLKQFSLVLDHEITDKGHWEVYDAIRDGSDLIKFQSWTRKELIGFANCMGESFLHTACRCENVAVAQQLLWLGADSNARSRRGETPLHLACRFGARACVELLLNHGSDVNARNLWNCTPLMWAVRGRSPQAYQIMLLLFQKGASTLEADVDGWTVLHCLAQSSIGLTPARERYALLCQNGAAGLLNEPNSFGTVPITSAIYWHNASVLAAYLEVGARADLIVDGRNIVHHAAAYGTLEVMQVLSQAPCLRLDTRSRSSKGHTPWSEWLWRKHNVKCSNAGYGEFMISDAMEKEFEHLLRTIRDRKIADEVKEIEMAISYLSHGRLSMANSILHQMRVQKQASKIHAEAETFRVISVQVAEGMIAPAIESLFEFQEVQNARLDVSPSTESSPVLLVDICHSQIGDGQAELNEISTRGQLKEIFPTKIDEEFSDSSDNSVTAGCSHEFLFTDKERKLPAIGEGYDHDMILKTPYFPITNASHLDARKSLSTYHRIP